MSGLLVVGGGGHGKVVADVARACGWEVVGFADADPAKAGRVVEPGGAAVVATQDELLRAATSGGPLPAGAAAVALAVGNNRERLRLAELLAGVPLPPLVHPSAVVSPSVRVGRGTVVFAAAVVNAGARLGDAAVVNTAVVVEHDCDVAEGAHLSPGAVLAGGVRVGRRAWVGANATVIQGIALGADVTVGAGAVVLRDVPDGTTVVGVPARAIRRAGGI